MPARRRPHRRPPRLGQVDDCVDFAVQLVQFAAQRRGRGSFARREKRERDGFARPSAGASVELANTVVRGTAQTKRLAMPAAARVTSRPRARVFHASRTGVPLSSRSTRSPRCETAPSAQRAWSRGAVGELSAAICVRQRASARPFAERVTAHSSQRSRPSDAIRGGRGNSAAETRSTSRGCGPTRAKSRRRGPGAPPRARAGRTPRSNRTSRNTSSGSTIVQRKTPKAAGWRNVGEARRSEFSTHAAVTCNPLELPADRGIADDPTISQCSEKRIVCHTSLTIPAQKRPISASEPN